MASGPVRRYEIMGGHLRRCAPVHGGHTRGDRGSIHAARRDGRGDGGALAAAAAAAQGVLDERAELVDQLGGADQADGGQGLAEGHVFEEA